MVCVKNHIRLHLHRCVSVMHDQRFAQCTHPFLDFGPDLILFLEERMLYLLTSLFTLVTPSSSNESCISVTDEA